MNVPSGYSALDLVGFTDKGDYLPSATYVKNDLVHYNDKIWKCLIDDTTAIEPTEGVNWTLWIQQSNSLDGLADVEITNAQDGQEITYDGTTQKWKNTSKIQTLTNQVKDMNEDTTALLDNLEVNGAVNMLPNNATSQTINGITFTVNPDKTVTVSGTQSSSPVGLLLNTDFSNLENGKTYKVTGANGTSGRTEVLEIRDETAGTNIVEQEAGVAAEFTYNSSHTYKASITLRNNGTTHSTTFKPMITVPSYNGDYVPYAKSNKELTEDVAENSMQIQTLTESVFLFSARTITVKGIGLGFQKCGNIVSVTFSGTSNEAITANTTFYSLTNGMRTGLHVDQKILTGERLLIDRANQQISFSADIPSGTALRGTIVYASDNFTALS